ncbi:MAG: hypothetical protein IJL02_05565 [Methanobrevibacter sp.]|uniref:hypothetical protein n=1 Tax=Methanobrevibacter sp. TaxID=66852 RepID=UPI0025EBF228|nr:hypothetical protein [Methanobrevibacter sp.]MBQ6099315.1 hypothetical protein [Methanobrevibacter sp.]
MSLLDEYGERMYKKGYEEETERIITNLLKSGLKAERIAKQADIPLEKVLKIKNRL